VWALAFRMNESLNPVIRYLHLEALGTKQSGQTITVTPLVVDEQYARRILQRFLR
jgi:hypothetical protein